MENIREKLQQLYDTQAGFSDSFYSNSCNDQYPDTLKILWQTKAETMDEANELLVASARAIGISINTRVTNNQISRLKENEDLRREYAEQQFEYSEI